MKRTATLLAALIVLSTVSVPVAAQAEAGTLVNYDTQPSFIVQFEDGEYSSLQAWAESSGEYSIVSHENNTTRALVSGPRWMVQSPTFFQNPTVAVLSGTPVAETPLEGRSYVKSVEPNYQHALPDTPQGMTAAEFSDGGILASVNPSARSVPTDGIAFSADANQTLIGTTRTHVGADGLSVDGAGVDVAVLDTGLNVRTGTDDPLYGTRITAAKNFVTDETAVASNDFANISDGNGHGSWVASAIAANASNSSYDGIAPGANLLVGKTLDDDGSGSTADIIDGIEWAEQQDADLISMSLGSPVYDEALADAIRDALAGNVTAVYLAVGNSRTTRPAQIASPSDVPEAGVISVAATNDTKPSDAGPAYFSQTGKDNGYSDGSMGATTGQSPDVAAPGMEITVPTYSESDIRQNSSLSGTSMATPVAAGVGALGLDANPSLENQTKEFVSLVENTTTAVPNAGVTEVGAGMVNATKMVNKDSSGPTQKESRTSPAKSRDAMNGINPAFQAIRKAQAAVGA